MIVNWPIDVNNKAYGLDISENDNIIYTEFESGKVRTRKRNSVAKGKYSFLLLLDDMGDDSEYKRFLSWWKNELQSGANTFYFLDFDTKDKITEYRSIEPFNARGQRYKEVSMSVEEV